MIAVQAFFNSESFVLYWNLSLIMIEYLAFCYEIFEEWNLYESNISDYHVNILYT